MLNRRCSEKLRQFALDSSASRLKNSFVQQPLLNDSHIRKGLIQHLNNQEIKPRAVIEELRVHNGNAVADVVALFDEAHCYEIKGDADKVERINVQSSYYNAAFRWITLAATERNLQRALRVAPRFWGIIVARVSDGEIVFHSVRTPKQNPKFVKELALLTLWKSELLELLERNGCQRTSRDILARLIATTKKKAELSSNICDILLCRHLAKHQSTPFSTV